MRKFWNWYALIYDSLRHLLPYQELLKQTIEALNIKEDNVRILDAGCGTGNLTLALAKSVPHRIFLDGIDASPAMLKRAEKKSKKLPWAHYQERDLDQSVPYSNEAYDSIVSLNVMYAAQNHEKILQEFWRILKFGGLIILVNPLKSLKISDVLKAHLRMMYTAGHRQMVISFIKTLFILPQLFMVILLNLIFIKKQASYGAYHFFNDAELENLLTRSGFRTLRKEFAYGNTAVFIVATKVFSYTDKTHGFFTVELAHRAQDLAALYRLRYDVYCEEMSSLETGNYPTKEEKDAYDQFSVHFILCKNREVIGTLRLIRQTPSGFLMEEAFPLPKGLDRAKVLEASRLIIRKDFRGKRLLRVLFDAGLAWSREHGYTHWCSTPQVGLLPILEEAGWNMEKLGPPTSYHNVRVIPVLRSLC